MVVGRCERWFADWAWEPPVRYGGLWKKFLSFVCTRCLQWKLGTFFLYDLVSSSLFLGIWVLLVECGTLDSSGHDFVRRACFVRQWIRGLRQCLALDEFHTFFTFTWTRILKYFFSFLTQNGELCSADASARSPLVRCSHLEL